MSKEYYIGLMSGTSIDGIDAGLYDFANNSTQVIDFYYQPYTNEIKQKIHSLCKNYQSISLCDYGALDTQLGLLYAEACLNLMRQAQVNAKDIKAIGSHGQTLYHSPNSALPFTIQIGDANIISQKTGITTIADFRRRDIAAGGQGAPLVPAFHQAQFQTEKENRVIVNIGGIANLSILAKNKASKTIGFDTGPGNTLMDYWVSTHKSNSYDNNGDWAATGQVQTELLKHLKDDPYFSTLPPKSTGTEYFSTDWLTKKLASLPNFSPEDVQRTLCQLTAETIAEAIQKSAPETEQVFLCGGGTHNQTLFKSLKQLLDLPIASTNTQGVHPDQVEAMAFAWLAKQTLQGLTGNLPETTGAKEAVILGGIYQA
ncbi:anhydro-N-acetylmuramic acid kinase [Bathymodiolus platifrons methanotrophic gill symbiont]|uniref:anhydro-N-acetylmuramic acid kinase n=1 Tax=Bathymodiolus platifrons methanotrophic gill symbiont TaxID=113268 RepID=UPI0011C8B900|nr:anhydro-N-acetylmuramic acid kinase [Bathymodiolus platifrons methanotrophic gill symbiont]MCK5869597.1 anhydro-N-acetylmuramic acid kinase [Methyloprofundus sp.]TXK95504.1 anhydro-N-acetylmuramic acid kinase [Methylococcaceae bacterium CS4]TXK98674.1 anhydro-N-acetylmuramic acid kinase [Methylococcaceae bacterium CS5]TXL03823.1 anhydro-N-acetylmuramic acid kinase [Methylococcaceae bacterium CS1]TXL07344.1 anhydro-N-acetylmuramic acid kinase [Methylococcaceae bacterium CS3]TXL07404.1 anhyd